MDDRGTGRTTNMLRALGEGRSVVVVHNSLMREQVLHIVRALNTEDNRARNVVAISVERPSDTERLRGLSCPIVADHAFWEHVSGEVAHIVSIFIARSPLPHPVEG